MVDFAILTEKRYLKNIRGNFYVENIFKEDSLVQLELENLGLKCSRVAWDDDFNPSEFKFALFRTTWNYFDHLTLFREFLKLCKDNITLINPHKQIVWNLDKKYLLELELSGINIPKTHLVKKGAGGDFTEICKQYGWNSVVIKPCVSAAAWNTYHIKKFNSKNNSLFSNLVKKQDMLIQVFQKNIVKLGEISLIMIGGKYSHAVLKRAQPGDFRVQDDFGGTVSLYTPTKSEVRFAENVIKKIPFSPIYARVDIVLDNDGVLALSELELIEPEMWFRLYPSAAKKIALGIKSFIENS